MNEPVRRQTPSRLTIAKITLVIISVLIIIAGLFAVYRIYSNNKTDGLNNGTITVESCSEVDWAWRIYSCRGDYFSTGGGMVDRKNVTVKYFRGELKEGAKIGDVYPPAFSTNENTDYFVTGRERASVTYNLPWLILVFIAIVIPLFTVGLFVTTRKEK